MGKIVHFTHLRLNRPHQRGQLGLVCRIKNPAVALGYRKVCCTRRLGDERRRSGDEPLSDHGAKGLDGAGKYMEG